MPTIKSLIVYDTGDSSVGEQGGYWEINFRGGIEVDSDEIELFRRDMSEIYVWDGGNKGRVEFDFETAKRLAGELTMDRMMDQASDTGDEMRSQQRKFDEIFGC